MKHAAISALASLAILMSMVNVCQSQMLPDVVCTYCAFLFRTEGCLEEESLFCKLLAFKFKTSIRGQQICPQFPCEGYGTSGHQCRGIFGCSLGNIRAKGICPLNKVCCAI